MQYKVIIRTKWLSILYNFQGTRSEIPGKNGSPVKDFFSVPKNGGSGKQFWDNLNLQSANSFHFTSKLLTEIVYRAVSRTCLQSMTESKRQLCLVTKASMNGVK